MSQRGAKSQEYCMYFKIEQRICGGKRPAAAEDTFNQRFLRNIRAARFRGGLSVRAVLRIGGEQGWAVIDQRLRYCCGNF